MRHLALTPVPSLEDGTYRMVDSPHHHAEKRVAGTEELHFLRDEVLFLGLARNGCGNAARRSHISANQPLIVVRVGGKKKILTESRPLKSPAHDSVIPLLFI